MYISTQRPTGIEFADVSRAYFYARARRNVYVQIADQDWEEGDDSRCGRLNLSMYGTRDAAQNWEAAYTRTMQAAGFEVTMNATLQQQKRS